MTPSHTKIFFLTCDVFCHILRRCSKEKRRRSLLASVAVRPRRETTGSGYASALPKPKKASAVKKPAVQEAASTSALTAVVEVSRTAETTQVASGATALLAVAAVLVSPPPSSQTQPLVSCDRRHSKRKEEIRNTKIDKKSKSAQNMQLANSASLPNQSMTMQDRQAGSVRAPVAR